MTYMQGEVTPVVESELPLPRVQDDEVEYKCLAIADIRQMAPKHKQAMAGGR